MVSREYIDAAYRTAMHIGLKPDEFWRLTPREYEDVVDGYRARQQDEYRRAAWMVHYIVAAWVKDPPDIDELLGFKTNA